MFARNPPMLDSVEIEKRYPAIAATVLDYGGNAGARTAVTVLAALLAAGAVVATGVIVVWRDRKVLRAASPVFCVTLLAGGSLMYATAIAVVTYAPSAAACVVRVWLGHLAFGVALTALLSKTWRVVRIFDKHERLAVVRITDADLMTYVGVYSAAVAIYLLVWTAVDAPTPTNVTVGATNYVVCASRASQWEWAPLIVEAALLTFACVLAYRARDHPQAFNESGWIALAMYNVVVVGGIVVLLLFSGLVDRPDPASFLVSIGLLFGNTALLLLLFVPKFLLIYRYGDNIDILRSSASPTEMATMAANLANNTIVRVRATTAATPTAAQKYGLRPGIEGGSDLGRERVPLAAAAASSSSAVTGSSPTTKAFATS